MADNETTTSSQLKFLTDDAVTVDAFGSHQRLADAIAEVVRNEPRLKVIGLLGPWGSGKSTVLRILQAKFEALDKDTHFFIYDAWAHQSDPPRRSFLETLIGDLVAKGLTSKDHWDDDLNKLSRRLEEHDTRTTPTLTFSGRIILLTILLFAVGLQLLNPAWLDHPVNFSTIRFDLPSLGILLVLSPVIAATAIYLSWRPTYNPCFGNFWSKSNWTQHRHPHNQSTITSLFVNKAIERITNRIVRTTDPTAIEFQDTYNRLMASVSAPSRKFVFVIDNLDRIAESEAVTLWSTVRSFFLGRSDEIIPDALPFKSPVVILPLDPGAVRRMYGTSHEIEVANELAQSFLDKTFDLTFRVGPPVLSDWHSYLHEKMKEALGNTIAERDLYAATRLYESFLTTRSDNKRAQITPRMVVKYVNAIVTLRLQWDIRVPFASLAYYAAHKERIEKDITSILNGDDPEISTFDPQWRGAVAAIYYGVDPDKALQVLMVPELQRSIGEPSVDAFSKLSIVPGFLTVLERVINSVETPGNPRIFSNTTLLLEKAPIPDSWWLNTLRRSLRQRIATSDAWASLGPEIADGIAAMIRSCPDDEIEDFLAVLAKKLSSVSADPLAAANAADRWVSIATALQKAASSRSTKPIEIQVPGDAKFFFQSIIASATAHDLLPALRTTQQPLSVVDQFVAFAVGSKFEGNIVTIFHALERTGTAWPWQKFISTAAQHIRDNAPTNDSLSNILRLLASLRRTPTTNSLAELKRLAVEGHLFDKLHQVHEAKMFEAEAAIVGTLLLTNPELSMTSTIGSSEAGKTLTQNLSATLADRAQVATSIDQFLEEYGDLAETITAAQHHKRIKPVVRQILTDRIKTQRNLHLRIVDVVARLPQYLELLDADTHNALLNILPELPSYWDTINKLKFDRTYFLLLGPLLSRDDSVGVKARESIEERLVQLQASEWRAFLDNAKEPTDLVLVLIESRAGSIDLGDALSNALQTLFDSALSGAVSDGALVAKWYKLTRGLSAYRRETLLKNIRDRFMAPAPAGGALLVLTNVDSEFLREGYFAAKPDDAVRHIIMPLLDHSDEGISWLITHRDHTSSWVKNADEGTRNHLADKLSELLQTREQSGQNSLIAAAEAWNLHEAISVLTSTHENSSGNPDKEHQS